MNGQMNAKGSMTGLHSRSTPPPTLRHKSSYMIPKPREWLLLGWLLWEALQSASEL